MKKNKHCNAISQNRTLPSKAQAGDPRSALEIKKSGLIEAGFILRNVQRSKPWFY